MPSTAESSSSRTAVNGGGPNGLQFLRFPRTDAPDKPRRPPNVTPDVAADGTVNYHKLVERDEPKSVLWRKAIGSYIAENAMGKNAREAKDYIIEDFPEGYTFWTHLKGPVDNPRTDPYLFGSPAVLKFRSTKEFQPHALWLFRESEEEFDEKCKCVYCSGERNQKTSERAKARAAGITPSPAKPKSSPVASSSTGPRKRGRPSKASLMAEPSPLRRGIAADGSPMSTPSKRKSEPKPKVPRPPPAPLRQVEADRHEDLAHWETRRYRENELVWAMLDPPIQGPEPWQRIELWPAIVKEQRALRMSDGTMGEVGSACTVTYLASSQTEIISSADIAAFLAYAVPTSLYQWLMAQDLPAEFRENMHRLDTFHPQASKAEPTIPLAPPRFPVFEEAWPSYIVAVNLGGAMFQKWSVSDPYEADRQWYLDFRLTPPRKFRLPGEEYTAKFVDFTLLQGMYLGAERIWQNDLVRLNTPWANLQGISREPTPGSATRGLFYEIRWILKKKVSKDREIITEGRLYELVPENAPDDIDLIKEEELLPPPAPVIRAPSSVPSVLPTHTSPPNGHMDVDSAEPSAPASEANGNTYAGSSSMAGTNLGASAEPIGTHTSTATTTNGATDAATHIPEHPAPPPVVQQPTPVTIKMKRLLLAQPPLKSKDGKMTFDYPLPQAPPGFKFRCLHKAGTIGVTVGPLAIAGRYYRHLMVESSRLQRILGDPARNGIGSDQIQSLAGALPGQLCAMMPSDYVFRGRGMTFVQSELEAKRELSARWGVHPDDWMYRFAVKEKEGMKRKFDVMRGAPAKPQPQPESAPEGEKQPENADQQPENDVQMAEPETQEDNEGPITDPGAPITLPDEGFDDTEESITVPPAVAGEGGEKPTNGDAPEVEGEDAEAEVRVVESDAQVEDEVQVVEPEEVQIVEAEMQDVEPEAERQGHDSDEGTPVPDPGSHISLSEGHESDVDDLFGDD